MKRLKAGDRREQIVLAALALAQGTNYKKVRRDDIAAACGITGQNIHHHFSTMPKLHRAIMRAACQRAVVGDKNALRVVAQGLADGNSVAARVSDQVRAAAKDLL